MKICIPRPCEFLKMKQNNRIAQIGDTLYTVTTAGRRRIITLHTIRTETTRPSAIIAAAEPLRIDCTNDRIAGRMVGICILIILSNTHTQEI